MRHTKACPGLWPNLFQTLRTGTRRTNKEETTSGRRQQIKTSWESEICLSGNSDLGRQGRWSVQWRGRSMGKDLLERVALEKVVQESPKPTFLHLFLASFSWSHGGFQRPRTSQNAPCCLSGVMLFCPDGSRTPSRGWCVYVWLVKVDL